MKGLRGSQLSLDPQLGRFERTYVRVLGAPANGLRIRMRRILPQTRGHYGTILDAGCGTGVFAMELAKMHPEAQVTGVDIEPELVERATAIARAAGITNVQFELGDVTALTFNDRFDLVVSVDNMEHVQDDVRAMTVLRNALHPGGTLVLHTPSYYRRWPVLKKTVNFDVPGHVRPGYHEEELVSKLREAGFEDVRSRFTYGVLENLTNNISYKISGANQENKVAYALVAPILHAVSYPGQFSQPRWGAGLLANARRPAASS